MNSSSAQTSGLDQRRRHHCLSTVHIHGCQPYSIELFLITAARTGNALSCHVTSTPSLHAVFYSRLKTHLFGCSFPYFCNAYKVTSLLDALNGHVTYLLTYSSPTVAVVLYFVVSWAVMSSPRGQSGLEVKILASASKIWPRPGLDLVVLLCNRACFGQKSCKIREFCQFF